MSLGVKLCRSILVRRRSYPQKGASAHRLPIPCATGRRSAQNERRAIVATDDGHSLPPRSISIPYMSALVVKPIKHTWADRNQRLLVDRKPGDLMHIRTAFLLIGRQFQSISPNIDLLIFRNLRSQLDLLSGTGSSAVIRTPLRSYAAQRS